METPKNPPGNGQLLDRQQLLQARMLENGGLAMSTEMQAVGYSKAYSKNPQKLKATKKWQAQVAKYLPDNKLLKRHSKLIDSKSDKVSLSAIELGYKLKGKLSSEPNEPPGRIGEEVREVIVRVRRLFPDSTV